LESVDHAVPVLFNVAGILRTSLAVWRASLTAPANSRLRYRLNQDIRVHPRSHQAHVLLPRK